MLKGTTVEQLPVLQENFPIFHIVSANKKPRERKKFFLEMTLKKQDCPELPSCKPETSNSANLFS